MQQLDPKLELSRPPRPLIESNPVAQPYPVQALGGILGPAVERMAKVIGVCPRHWPRNRSWLPRRWPLKVMRAYSSTGEIIPCRCT